MYKGLSRYNKKRIYRVMRDNGLLLPKLIEERFSGGRALFLSDRGSIYRAYNVQVLARRLGLKSCFTRAYSLFGGSLCEALKERLCVCEQLL